MTTLDLITELFCRVDDCMRAVPMHPLAKLSPGEIVTIGLLFALKGVGNRAFYRWLKRDGLHCFPQRPERTRLFRLLTAHQDWTNRFLADPTVLGVADSYGIELLHPIRDGRSPKQVGQKGLSNRRWIVGGKLGLVVNQFGLVCAWGGQTANVYDATFQPLVRQFEEQMIVLADTHFHAKVADPSNLKICQHKTWGVRMVIETVLSMLTTVCHFKKVTHRVWKYFQARLAFTMALFVNYIEGQSLRALMAMLAERAIMK
jgi:hypothetical protein